MPAGAPETALKAAGWRFLPVSGWPWRSAGYLFATVGVAVVAAAGLAVPAGPWLVLAAGGFQAGTIAALVLLGGALVAALRPLLPVHRLAAGDGRAAWLRARYTDPVAWRETGYSLLLATVVPALCAAALVAVLLAGVLIASPVVVSVGGGPVALVVGQVYTVRQSVPYVIVGVATLPVLPYLVTLVAGADAALLRALAFGRPEEELRAELTEVTASRAPLADAFEAERRRIERDLHDGAQQKLVSLTMQLGLARLALPPDSPAAASVAAAHDQARQLMTDLRELIHGIQPQILTDLGLPAALDELAGQAAIPVTIDAHLDGRLPGHVENTAYFAVAEALTNIAKHSGATQASVQARVRDRTLVVEVTDNGRGGADPGRGSGLTGLADRAAVAGGRMLLSSPPGGPT